MWKPGLMTVVFSMMFLAASCGDSPETPQSSGEPANMLIIETSLGTIKCELYPDKTPMTVDIISSLAEGTREWTHPESGAAMTNTPYYDGLIFHRVIPNFMIQTGDPIGTGTGSPGFVFDDELHEELLFDQPGRLAMAHRGPNTNGGQIFITVAPTPHLNMVHTIFGQVVEGQEVADAISEVPANQSRPIEEVSIVKVTVVRGEGE
jgi:peptidyl-prolyl cis-trans isomerase A (cyclophilin A)